MKAISDILLELSKRLRVQILIFALGYGLILLLMSFREVEIVRELKIPLLVIYTMAMVTYFAMRIIALRSGPEANQDKPPLEKKPKVVPEAPRYVHVTDEHKDAPLYKDTTVVAGTIVKERYRVGDLLSSSNMSSVYEATDLMDNTRCLVKAIPGTDFPVQIDWTSINIDNPKLAKVRDTWVSDNIRYEVLEYYDAWSLSGLLRENPKGFGGMWLELWLIELLEILIRLHGHDPCVVHRDVSPSNILVTKQKKQVVLVDCTSAVFYKPGEKSMPYISSIYSPPEQYEGFSSPSGDIYSVSATFYHLAGGKPPPSAIQRQQGVGIEWDKKANWVLHALDRGIELDPAKRFTSASTMLQIIEEARARTRVIPPDYKMGNFPR